MMETNQMDKWNDDLNILKATTELLSVSGGTDGDIDLDFARSEEIPAFSQSYDLQEEGPEDVRRRLLDTILKVSLPKYIADVRQSGYAWRPNGFNSAQWDMPSEAYTTLDVQIPEIYAGYEESETEGKSGEPLYVERRIDPEQDLYTSSYNRDVDGDTLWGQRRAQSSSKENVKGLTGGRPIIPGGEEWGAELESPNSAAVLEARSGSWLKELMTCIETGRPNTRIVAPGMEHGAFGLWEMEESLVESMDASCVVQDRFEEGISLSKQRAETAMETSKEMEEQKSLGAATVKMHLGDLFNDVWVIKDEVEEEEKERDLSAMEEESQMDAPLYVPDKQNVPSDTTNNLLESIMPSTKEERFPSENIGKEPLDLIAVLDKASAVAEGILSVRDLQRSSGSKNIKEPDSWAVRAAVQNMDTEWKALKSNLARDWPFELDVFQKEAIMHMEMGHSVFVAAHTSAGKTVAAEYAFALASKHCTRAIYTSPIKTISNQKFRDFSESGFEVGLLTGDVSIRPESSCLIMTTEILRSMLYKGADIVRDIEWVVFDEVHYVNDAERGVVWEEVIIMLPEYVNLVLLSATVPNVLEFANWVGRTKRKMIYVTGTTRRPVPLQHSLYYSGQLYAISSPQFGYDPKGYRQAKEAYSKKNALPQTKAEVKAALPTGRGDSSRGRGRSGRGMGQSSKGIKTHHQSQDYSRNANTGLIQLRAEKTLWNSMIEFLRKKDMLPVVVFCFSKKRCDALVSTLRSLDLTNASEKSEIHLFCDKSLARLQGSDKEIPQVLRVREMLKRGLGVHHAGLLPIVKEIVEMLFCRGIIKVLFSTETFAMGVNAPARTVVFQSVRKHDGRSFRTLLPGEYTQMAGRAGRRGLDSVGNVVIMSSDTLPDESELKKLLTGAATKLESQFRLTYSMILNLLRVEDLTVEDMMKRSFAEFHAQRAQPEVIEAMERAQKVLKKLHKQPWPKSPLETSRKEVEEYTDILLDIESLEHGLQDSIMSTRGAISLLTIGRVVLIRRHTTGVAELGIVIDDPIPGTGRSTLGPGPRRNFPELPGSDANESEALKRKKTILMLYRSSPMEDPISEINDINPDEASNRENESNVPDLGLKVLRKKDDDDDVFGGLGRKVGKGKAKGKQIQKRATRISLPKCGSVGTIKYIITELPILDIVGIFKSKVEVDTDSVLSGDLTSTATAVNKLLKLQEESNTSNLTLMDPVSDLKITDFSIAGDIRQKQNMMNKMVSMTVNQDPLLPEMLAIVRSEKLLARRLARLASQTSNAGLAQLPEFNQRVVVLQRMGYLGDDRTVTMKGRVACEINSGDELVATELIYGGVLTDLEPEEAVSILSALVFQEKTDNEPSLPPSLSEIRDKAIALTSMAGEIQRDAGLNIVPEEFVANTLKFGLMEVVYEWAKGTPFAEICKLTDIMEGSIVRTIVRLDETCREVRDAARVMGDMVLYKLMEDASEAIKRDIVFAASLYVS